MTDNRGDPRRITGVLAAIGWLMGGTPPSEDILLTRARVAGLLRKDREGGLLTYDGTRLACLIRHRMRSGRLPPDGAVLVGIGEMTARSHAPRDEIESVMGRLLRRAYPEAVRLRVLREALDLVRSTTTPSGSSSPRIYENDELSITDWMHITLANRWMQHPVPLGAFYGYGLGFVARVLLRNAPARLRWLAEEAEKRRLLPAIVASVGEACFWSDNAARRALRSAVPLFTCFAVIKLRDGGEDGKGWMASAVNSELIDHKTPVEGRIQVSAFMLKEAVHAWYRQKDRPSENRRRRAVLEIYPHEARGGERYAASEIERLRSELPELQSRQAGVEVALNDALETAAQQDFAPKKLWGIFEPSLVDTPEIRHRFAMAHPEGAIRREALSESLVAFDKLVGCRDPEGVCGEKFDQTRAKHGFAYWAASSQVELSNSGTRDAGRDAAQRIDRVETNLREFVLQPFAASRFHERFQNALSRWSLVLQFALTVSLLGPMAPLTRLRDLALESAWSFLPIASRSAHDPRWEEAVAGLVAEAVSTKDMTEAQKWIGDGQPVLVRLQVLWSSPEILGENLQLATSLIEQVASRKMGLARAGRNASQLLGIVDRAAVAMTQKKRSDLYAHLAIPFSKAIAREDAPLAKCVALAVLIAALNGDVAARSQLLNDPVWGHSRISEMLRRTASISP